MKITEIRRRLMNSIGPTGSNTFNRALGLALYNGAIPKNVKDTYHLARWYEMAPREVKKEFLDVFNEKNDDLRICTNCGCFMYEGYLLGIEYACSDKCAIELYQGDESQLRKDIKESIEDDNGEFFWTEW